MIFLNCLKLWKTVLILRLGTFFWYIKCIVLVINIAKVGKLMKNSDSNKLTQKPSVKN